MPKLKLSQSETRRMGAAEARTVPVSVSALPPVALFFVAGRSKGQAMVSCSTHAAMDNFYRRSLVMDVLQMLSL
jgi:hypothetical protein